MYGRKISEWLANRKPSLKECEGKYKGLCMRRESPGIDRNFEQYLVYLGVLSTAQAKLIKDTEWIYKSEKRIYGIA